MILKKDKFEQMNCLLRNYMINMKHFYTELAPELDITPQQAHTLFYIEKHAGLIQRELGDHFHLRNASVTSMVKNLERDGYIIRKADQESARIKRIFLTKKGEEKTNEVKEIFDKAYLQIISRLDERDIDAIVKGMTNINNNLKK